MKLEKLTEEQTKYFIDNCEKFTVLDLSGNTIYYYKGSLWTRALGKPARWERLKNKIRGLFG